MAAEAFSVLQLTFLLQVYTANYGCPQEAAGQWVGGWHLSTTWALGQKDG